MGERLKLSWERIREIPGETDQSTLHGVFFAIFKGKRGRKFK